MRITSKNLNHTGTDLRYGLAQHEKGINIATYQSFLLLIIDTGED